MHRIELATLTPPPSVLLFADAKTEREGWCAAIEAAGGAALAADPLASLTGRLAGTASSRVVALVFDGEADSQIADAIHAGERFAADAGGQLLVSAPIEAIDAAIGSSSDATTILCRPDFADRVTALALAFTRTRPMVMDNASLDGLRLKRLADEVNRIARALANLSDPEPATAPAPRYEAASVSDVQLGFRPPPQAAPLDLTLPAEVRSMLRLRRMRDRFFPGDLFADPAWDMLLDLFAARMEGDNVAVSSLCIAAAVPPTTALRWIKTMTDAELFERHADPMDGRRIFIRLSDRAMDGMQRFFAAANAQGRMI